jgi:hypothetical protein
MELAPPKNRIGSFFRVEDGPAFSLANVGSRTPAWLQVRHRNLPGPMPGSTAKPGGADFAVRSWMVRHQHVVCGFSSGRIRGGAVWPRRDPHDRCFDPLSGRSRRRGRSGPARSRASGLFIVPRAGGTARTVGTGWTIEFVRPERTPRYRPTVLLLPRNLEAVFFRFRCRRKNGGREPVFAGREILHRGGSGFRFFPTDRGGPISMDQCGKHGPRTPPVANSP